MARLNGPDAIRHAKSHSNALGAPATKPSADPPSVLKVCSECFSELGPGLPHNCVKTVKRSNIAAIVRNNSEKSVAAVTVSALHDVAQQQGVGARGGKVLLKSGSKFLPVVVGSRRVCPPGKMFSHQDLMDIQNDLNLSDNSTL